MELLLISTVFMTSEIVDGAAVGATRTVSVTPWLRLGLLRLVSLAFASPLLGSTTRSFEPLRRWVARQLVSTTLPSISPSSTIQSPTE